MALHGRAFLALWNDVDPGRAAEYELWHAGEHVPERVSIPGMLAARRYVSREASRHRFLTLYDAASLAVFASEAYRAVADRPTPWSLSMRPSLQAFHRVPCEILQTSGLGLQAHALAVRFALAPGRDLPARPASLRDVSFHLGRADPDARFPVPNAVAAGPGVQYVLIVEAGHPQELTELESATSVWLDGASERVSTRYSLMSALRHDEVDPNLWRAGRTAT